MSRNGSGGYSPPSNSWSPAINGAAATAADWNAILLDIAEAIQQSVSADGQTPLTGNLNLGGNKLTNLGAGISAGNSLRFEQLFSQGSLTDIASAATVDIGAQLTNFLRVTGTTGITSFGANYNGPKFLIFSGAVTLTHSATLVLPTGANITTDVNDSLIAIPISGGWQVVAYQKADGSALISFATQIQAVTASVAGNALTVGLNPTTLEFRSTTLSNGVPNKRAVPAAISLTVPNTATLGTVSGVSSRIVIVAIDNAGTVELAVINIAGGANLNETGLISTTAISGASTSASVFYSATARTSVPYRVVGCVDSTQATAGTWATAPSLVQGMGGNALGAMQAIGYGQTWQAFSRTIGTTYYNTTGRPISVSIFAVGSANTAGLLLRVNGLDVAQAYGSLGTANPIGSTLSAIVPPGGSYSVQQVGNGGWGVNSWHELR